MTFTTGNIVGGEAGQYPTAFGITFTPIVLGIGLGLMGIVGSVLVGMTFVMPTYEKYNKLKAEEADKQAQVNLQKNGDYQRKLAQTQQELLQAQKLQETAYSLFATEEEGDTLLLDINKIVRTRQAEMKDFTPDNKAVVVNDGSLGPLVNNKLKRKSFELHVEGEVLRFRELMRDLERLQPLLLIKDFKAVVTRPDATGQFAEGNNRLLFRAHYQNGKLTYEQEKKSRIKAQFRLDLIFPLSPEEMAKLNPPPAKSPAPK